MPYLPRYLSFYLGFFRGASFGDETSARFSVSTVAAVVGVPSEVGATIAEGEVGALHP